MGTGDLNLDECFAQIVRARELHEELVDAINEWTDSGGVVAESRRSLQFVCYIGFVKVNAAPPGQANPLDSIGR
jgi:hypothetical protein